MNLSGDNKTGSPSSPNTILVIGSKIYSDGYPRNREIIESLQESGWNIQWCALPYPRSFSGFSLATRLAFIFLYTPFRWLYMLVYSIYLRLKSPANYVYVPFPGHLDIPVAWLIARLNGAKLVVDIFLCIYNTLIQDRRLFSENSISAKIIYHAENLLLKMPDYGLIDTEEHRTLITSLYNNICPIYIVPVGIDEKLFSFSLPPNSNTVIFWGTYIKLHGVDTIIRAAALVQNSIPEIKFKLIGAGQELEKEKARSRELKTNNIIFVEKIIPIKKLIEHSRTAFCALGIFGTSEKSNSVFPYKAVQALALGLPLITARTPVSDRVLKHNYSAILIPADNEKALSDAVISLYNNHKLGRMLAKNGRDVFEQTFSRQKIKFALSKIFND